MKRSANRRRSPAAEQRKKQRREQLVKFLRLNTWLVLLAVLVLTTVITFAVTAGTVHLCLAVQRRLGGGARA